MNDRIPYLIYKRLSNDWRQQDSPVRLNQFSRTPLLEIRKELGRRSIAVRGKALNKRINCSLDKYSVMAKKIGMVENRKRKYKEKVTVLPPIRFLKKDNEDSDDEGLSLKEFLKKWKYIE